MSISQLTWRLAAAWLLLLGGYAAAVALIPGASGRAVFGSLFLCLLPLLSNAALLSNASTPNWRKNTFWMLLAFGGLLWMAGQFIWAYVAVYQHRPVPNPFVALIPFFLHTVPMIAALTLRPDARESDRGKSFSYVDSSLLLVWWIYFYLLLVVPWQYVVFNQALSHQSFDAIYIFENFVFVLGAIALSWNAAGRWQRIYAHLAGAGTVYLAGSLLIGNAIDRGVYAKGSLYDLPVIASFLWMGTAGLLARCSRDEEKKNEAENAQSLVHPPESGWESRLASAALLSLPLIGLWCMTMSRAPRAIVEFRILVTLGAVVPLAGLIFLRRELMDADRLRLLRASQESLENLKRLQTQFVQSEKLASLGQIVAGAAHEINNPLTAILGFSDLLVDDQTIGIRPRRLAKKIREQAQRTKSLVGNLLNFARQSPVEQRSLLNVNTILDNSIQLRRLSLRGKNIRLELLTTIGIPAIRGVPNQLVQVFFNIIGNAVDAMEEVGGGTLTVRTLYEKSSVVILFSDTGPGILEPSLVFDPFYTTKAVGKGTGLGLSICYGLINDHGGQITCYNPSEGGATFRIELPAVPSGFPDPELVPAQSEASSKPN